LSHQHISHCSKCHTSIFHSIPIFGRRMAHCLNFETTKCRILIVTRPNFVLFETSQNHISYYSKFQSIICHFITIITPTTVKLFQFSENHMSHYSNYHTTMSHYSKSHKTTYHIVPNFTRTNVTLVQFSEENISQFYIYSTITYHFIPIVILI